TTESARHPSMLSSKRRAWRIEPSRAWHGAQNLLRHSRSRLHSRGRERTCNASRRGLTVCALSAASPKLIGLIHCNQLSCRTEDGISLVVAQSLLALASNSSPPGNIGTRVSAIANLRSVTGETGCPCIAALTV